MLALTLVTALLGANLLFLAARHGVNVPFWDQWDLLEPRFLGQNAGESFLLQHGPHRQGLGGWLTTWIHAASSLDIRFECLFIATLPLVGVIVLLGWKRHVTGPLEWSDLLFPFILLTPLQWETIAAVPNASHSILPLLLCICTAGTLTRAPSPGRGMLLGLLSGLLTFTGFGLLGALTLDALLVAMLIRGLARRDPATMKDAIGALALAALAWFWFSRGYVFQPAVPDFRFPREPLSDYAWFMAWMLAAPLGFDAPSGWALAAGILLLVAAMTVFAAATVSWWRRPQDAIAAVSIFWIGTGLLFAAATAAGRVSLGTGAGMASRYTALLLPITLGIAISAPIWRRRSLRGASLAFVWVGVALTWLPAVTEPAPFGEWGLRRGTRAVVAEITARKLAWIAAYRTTGEWRAAQSAAGGDGIYPADPAPRLERSIAVMRASGWSFARVDATAVDWYPLLPRRRLELSGFFEPETGANLRWMGAEAALRVFNRQPSWLNVELVDTVGGLPLDATLTVECGASRIVLPVRPTPLRWSIPVPAGDALLRFVSTGGAHRPAEADGASAETRALSLNFRRIDLTGTPVFPAR